MLVEPLNAEQGPYVMVGHVVTKIQSGLDVDHSDDSPVEWIRHEKANGEWHCLPVRAIIAGFLSRVDEARVECRYVVMLNQIVVLQLS